jgi:hypothetical protein
MPARAEPAMAMPPLTLDGAQAPRCDAAAERLMRVPETR